MLLATAGRKPGGSLAPAPSVSSVTESQSRAKADSAPVPLIADLPGPATARAIRTEPVPCRERRLYARNQEFARCLRSLEGSARRWGAAASTPVSDEIATPAHCPPLKTSELLKRTCVISLWGT